jgi:hypothetical protein
MDHLLKDNTLCDKLLSTLWESKTPPKQFIRNSYPKILQRSLL